MRVYMCLHMYLLSFLTTSSGHVYVVIRYTVFELTFSGGWIVRVRPVVESVSYWYAIPFLCYITSHGLQFKVSRVLQRYFVFCGVYRVFGGARATGCAAC